MKKRPLGNTKEEVSLICLGTMTWGEQNTEAEAFSQMDFALEHQVDFWDTAELYPVPPAEKTYTLTESYIGNWFKKSGKRDKVFLASKVAGKGAWVPWIRAGKNQFDEINIRQACEGSLKRLQTDVIDLYQLHWPDRKTNFFGQLGFKAPSSDESVPIEETIKVMAALIKEGKIRHYGLSNETAWGAMKWLYTADQMGLPRPVSIQNPYSLLNRSFEVGLAEVAHREQLGLLAYSPLGFGVLSGKYLDGQAPANARLNLFGKHFKRYTTEIASRAVRAYAGIAKEAGLSPAQLALAFVNSRNFLTSNIIGATDLKQLDENIKSAKIELSKDIYKKIEAVHAEISNPAP